MTTFNVNKKYQRLAIAVRILQNPQKLIISRCSFSEDGKEMYQEL